MQLDAALRSFSACAGDVDAMLSVNALWKADPGLHAETYHILTRAAEHTRVHFLEENTFRDQVLSFLDADGFVLCMVDDALWLRPVPLRGAMDALSRNDKVIGVSFRVGRNTGYSYAERSQQRIPSFRHIGSGLYVYEWKNEEHDFGYPLEVSGSMYRSRDLHDVLAAAEFSNPNVLEGRLAEAAGMMSSRRPLLMCLETSATVSLPLNRVQRTTANRSGDKAGYDADALARLYLDGVRINIEAYRGIVPNACHQELPLRFVPSDASVSASVPRVSVVMPARNAAPYIAAAADSIFAQTMSDFEFLVIEDASTDGTGAVLDAINDPRLRLLRNSTRLGQAASFMRGVAEASGTYIARMDADDHAHPLRLEKQCAFLDAHPDVGILGAAVRTFGDAWNGDVRYPERHADIAAGLLFRPQIANPVVMFRTSVLRSHGAFDSAFDLAEDYEFWLRCLPFVQFANLPEVLLRYRSHPGQVGRMFSDEQAEVTRTAQNRVLQRLGIDATREELLLHHALGAYLWRSDPAWLAAVESWLRRLRSANDSSMCFDFRALDAVLGRLWFDVCRRATEAGLAARRIWHASPLAALYRPARLDRAQFLVDALRRKRR